eukprot:m.170825 g.170825  ORF g.170825 m.170825 type:complete len:104 (+) comp39047_c0_seq5:3630-3941(+)
MVDIMLDKVFEFLLQQPDGISVRFLCAEIGHTIEQTYEIWKKGQNGEQEKTTLTTTLETIPVTQLRSGLSGKNLTSPDPGKPVCQPDQPIGLSPFTFTWLDLC